MKVVFTTAIDAYKKNCFPETLTQVPRKGDRVGVAVDFVQHFSRKNLPVLLEVVQVTWYENTVYCELHYSEIDLKIAQANGTNLYP